MFLSYVHQFRGIAIFYIVAGQAISDFDWHNNPELQRITTMLLGNGTVFFVFIAGYLFQHLSKQYEPKKYLSTKLKVVILPYLLVSLPAIIYFVFYQERYGLWPGFYENPQWLQVVYFYLNGSHLAPLWFVPMIFLFYLVAPLLIVFDKDRWPYLLLPALIMVSIYIPRGSIIQSFYHFFSIYFFGMFLSHFKNKINIWLTKFSVICLLLALFFSLIYVEYYFEDYGYINFIRKLVVCCLFIGCLLKFNIKFYFIGLLANYSFGIFFIHSYLISLIKMSEHSFIGHYWQGHFIAFLLFVFAILLICIGMIDLIKKRLPTYSRHLIGC